ncbi:hypothetical protein G6F64_015332 [Rhizopus arrhizus]|uniref:Uncharacterized protein n=1 Tax=Rhizopus oryzae TaxID=64495 RepID=A0A9P7BIS0_RHIOR|nr:hypothetical protein G6F64_015332 [Rhizopus arrhizus]
MPGTGLDRVPGCPSIALQPSRWGCIKAANQSWNTARRRERWRRCGYSSDTGMAAARKAGMTSTSLPASSRCWTSKRGIWMSPSPARQQAM